MTTITNYSIKELIAFRRIEKNWGKFTIYDMCNLIALGLYRPIQFLDGEFFKSGSFLTLYDVALVEIANQIYSQFDEMKRDRLFRQRDAYAKIITPITEKLSKLIIENDTYCVFAINYTSIEYVMFTTKDDFMEKLSLRQQHLYYIFDAVGFIRRLDKTIKK